MVNEPTVSIARWLAAMIVGLGVWLATTFLASFVTGQVVAPGSMTPLIGLVVWVFTVVVGVFVAGRVVGARSVRRWVIVSVLAGGLIVAVTAALAIAFLSNFN